MLYQYFIRAIDWSRQKKKYSEVLNKYQKWPLTGVLQVGCYKYYTDISKQKTEKHLRWSLLYVGENGTM